MEKPLRHEAVARIVLLEAHRFVDRAADEAIATITHAPPARLDASPPSEHSASSDDLRHAVASAIAERRRGTTLAYPPSDEARLTDEEIAALAALPLPAAARSALRKIVREAASAPLFHLFCLLDGVGDPELTRVAAWPPVNLEPARDHDTRAMMHDDFFESYWQYVDHRAGRESV